jgi:hypothetical protein
MEAAAFTVVVASTVVAAIGPSAVGADMATAGAEGSLDAVGSLVAARLGADRLAVASAAGTHVEATQEVASVEEAPSTAEAVLAVAVAVASMVAAAPTAADTGKFQLD